MRLPGTQLSPIHARHVATRRPSNTFCFADRTNRLSNKHTTKQQPNSCLAGAWQPRNTLHTKVKQPGLGTNQTRGNELIR